VLLPFPELGWVFQVFVANIKAIEWYERITGDISGIIDAPAASIFVCAGVPTHRVHEDKSWRYGKRGRISAGDKENSKSNGSQAHLSSRNPLVFHCVVAPLREIRLITEESFLCEKGLLSVAPSLTFLLIQAMNEKGAHTTRLVIL